MKNRYEFGIKLLGGADQGIQAITLYDITDSVYIKSDGTTSLTSVGRLFDCYCSANYSTKEKEIVYWMTLTEGHEYDISINPSGTKNALSTNYGLTLIDYLQKDKWVDAYIQTTVRMWHEDFPSDFYEFTPINRNKVELVKSQSFTSDGIITDFVLSTGRAAEFLNIIVNGVVLETYDTSLSWGADTEYSNDTIDATTKRFGVRFVEAPTSGTVTINYKPFVNKYKVMKYTKQARDIYGNNISNNTNIREQDYSCEFI